MTWTPTTLTMKDAAGTSQPIIAYTDATNFAFGHPLLDNTGAIVPLVVGHGTAASAIRVELPTDGTGLVAANITKVGGSALAIGQAAMAASLPVVFSSDQTPVFPKKYVGDVITRPADTNIYASGDLVAASTTAATVNGSPTKIQVSRVADQPFSIYKAGLRLSGAVVNHGLFRMHFYGAAPTVSNGDNGVWLTDQTANYLGYIDITLEQAFTDGCVGAGVSARGQVVSGLPVSGQNYVYYTIEVKDIFTPISGETLTPWVEVF